MAASQHVFLALLAALTLLVQVGYAQQVVRIRGRPRSRARSFAPVPTVPLVSIMLRAKLAVRVTQYRF